MNLPTLLKNAKRRKIHSINHLLFLIEIAKSEAPIPNTVLAKRTDSDQAACNVTISALQDKDYIKKVKVTDPETFKERACSHITDQGKQLLKFILTT